MRKKLLNITLTILMLLVLVSCIELKNNTEYESPNIYENKIIETTNLLEKTTVTLTSGSDIVGSAVIIDKSSKLNSNIITAITTTYLVDTYKEDLKVMTGKTSNTAIITDYAKNDKYGIALIQFSTKVQLDVARVLASPQKAFDYYVGQTILTLGTNLNASNYNAVKVGMITNDKLPYKGIEDYVFMHDATHNPGDEGAGVFDINGNLIGLNAFNYIQSDQGNKDYILGATLAYPAKRFASLLNNLDSVIYSSKTILDDLFEQPMTSRPYVSKFPYEDNKKALNIELRNKTINVDIAGTLASGLIYSKEDGTNNYWVITKSYELGLFESIKIYSANHERLNILKSFQLKDMYLSIHKVSSPNELEVYNSTAINTLKGKSITEGQSLVSVGSPIDKMFAKTFNRATLSKVSFSDGIFMHDGNLNYGQEGAPLFNLDGDLVGFNIEKENEVVTTDGALLAEGIAFAVDINYVAEAINTVTMTSSNLNEDYEYKFIESISPYIPKYSVESDVINIINNVMDKTVTVKTERGHGSGVIYNKEQIRPGTYRYSVLTNHHVISNSQEAEISIAFNDDNLEVFAIDYTSTPLYDVAVVRFISSVDHDVIESKAIDKGQGILTKKGQSVIAVGTPSLVSLNGYVSTGNITSDTTSSSGIVNLYINHNTAINPGNSGGPLFDLNGNLLGLNVSKTTYLNGNGNGEGVPAEGVGHSLNLNVLSPVINSYKDSDYRMVVKKPRLGITVANIEGGGIDPSLIPNVTKGVVVLDTDEKRDAYGKLFTYDVITEINGVLVETIEDVAALLDGKTFGEVITIKALRLVDGSTIEQIITVTLK